MAEKMRQRQAWSLAGLAPRMTTLSNDKLLAMSVPGIILAAGASRRLGRPKQLLECRGETLLGRTIRIAEAAGVDPLLVVLGAHAAEICASVAMADVVSVLNPEWQEGMASSIRAGLRALFSCASNANGVVILSCDQPRLSSGHISKLVHSFEAGSESMMVASFYHGVRGVPAIFPRSAFARLLALEGDKGARAILVDPACAVAEVPFPGGELDIDLPSDLQQLT